MTMIYSHAIKRIAKRLSVYLPSVLTIIVTDYCCPVLIGEEISLMLSDKEMTEMPPPDVLWVNREQGVYFGQVDGSSLGYLPHFIPPFAGNVFHVLRGKSKLYLLHPINAIPSNEVYWNIRTFDFKSPATTKNISTGRRTKFGLDGDQLTVIDNRVYYYLDKPGQPIVFKHNKLALRPIDICVYRGRYFVLIQNAVVVYHRKRLTKSSFFRLNNRGFCDLITVNKHYILISTIDRCQTWLELYTHSGRLVSRSKGLTNQEPRNLRLVKGNLRVDRDNDCHLLKMKWI